MFYLYHVLQIIVWTCWFFLVQFVGEGRSQKWGFIWRFFIIGVFLRVLFKINNSPFPQIPGEEKPKLSWDTFSLILSLCHSVQVTFIAVMMMMKDIIIIINKRRCQMDSLLHQVLMKRYWNTLTIKKYYRANDFFPHHCRKHISNFITFVLLKGNPWVLPRV